MKKLVILTLFASSAFAGTVKFDNKTFLALAGGDATAAQELYYYCETSGVRDCAATLSGDGNLKAEAARNCAQRSRATLFTFNPNLAEIYKRAGITGGTTYRTKVPHKDESGTHVHLHTDDDIKRAIQSYRATLYAQALAIAEGKRGSKEVTSGGKIEGSLGIDAKLLGTGVGVAVTPGSHIDTTEIKAKLTPEEIAAIEKEALTASDDPFLKGGVVPSELCMIWEKFCTIGANKQVPNPYYDPKAKDDSKSAERNDDKKGAENPPQHEDETTPDIPAVISSDSGDLWAGNDTNPKDGTWATPIEIAFDKKSPMEQCVEKENKRLNDEFGKKRVNQEGAIEESDKEKNAKDLLRHGYCDEEILGRDFCRQHKFQQDSVVAVDIQQERKEAAKAALNKLFNKGQCDAQALGTEFCKKNSEKWLKTPAGQDPADEAGKNKLPIPGSGTGDLPRINP